MEKLNKENIQTVAINEPSYPALLKEITDPPFVLFVRGKLPGGNSPALGRGWHQKIYRLRKIRLPRNGGATG